MKSKKTMARRMRTRSEIKRKVSIFLTEAWTKRKIAIAKRVKKVEERRKRK